MNAVQHSLAPGRGLTRMGRDHLAAGEPALAVVPVLALASGTGPLPAPASVPAVVESGPLARRSARQSRFRS